MAARAKGAIALDFLQPSVSVVVPVYNQAATIESCVQSLLELDYPRHGFRVVVVDNASTDGTPEILSRFGDQIATVEEATRGPSAARNRGLLEAQGEIVAFTDGDCVARPDWLRSIVGPLVEEGVDIVGGRILATEPSNEVEKYGERVRDIESAITRWRPPYVDTANCAFRASVVRDIGLFDERLPRAEDCDLSYRLFEAGYGFAYAEDAIVYHHNESTYRGLLAQGFSHGFHSVRLNKKHRRLIKACGYARVKFGTWLRLVRLLVHSIREPTRTELRCDAIFNFGKRVGKLLGSARFGFLDI